MTDRAANSFSNIRLNRAKLKKTNIFLEQHHPGAFHMRLFNVNSLGECHKTWKECGSLESAQHCRENISGYWKSRRVGLRSPGPKLPGFVSGGTETIMKIFHTYTASFTQEFQSPLETLTCSSSLCYVVSWGRALLMLLSKGQVLESPPSDQITKAKINHPSNSSKWASGVGERLAQVSK